MKLAIAGWRTARYRGFDAPKDGKPTMDAMAAEMRMAREWRGTA